MTDEKSVPHLRDLLGDTVVDNTGGSHDVGELKDKIVGLYFSAHWYVYELACGVTWRKANLESTCVSVFFRMHDLASTPTHSILSTRNMNRCPPCRQFTPVLASIYNELQTMNKPFEIVFVSSDRDAASKCTEAYTHVDICEIALPDTNNDFLYHAS